MQRNAGMSRSADGLSVAMTELVGLGKHRVGPAESVEELEVANLVTVGTLITNAAWLRTESRGCHFRRDFPGRDETWTARIVQQRGEPSARVPVSADRMPWAVALIPCDAGAPAAERPVVRTDGLGVACIVFASPDSSHLIALALAEDLGVAPARFTASAAGDTALLEADVTSFSAVGLDARFSGTIVARQACVVAGLPVVAAVYDMLSAAAGLGDPVEVFPLVAEGARVGAGTRVAEVEGVAAAVLAGERTALDFLMELSGIATLTATWVEAADGRFEVCDTRKTLAGHRALAKYAVGVGGGTNHRAGLHDMVLIKDNHIRRAGGITSAVAKARAAFSDLKIEVEADTLPQALEAAEAGADLILLDNFDDRVARLGGQGRSCRRREGRAQRRDRGLGRHHAGARAAPAKRRHRSHQHERTDDGGSRHRLRPRRGRLGRCRRMSLLQSLLEWALSALGTYGYLIVFSVTVLENLFIVGSFTPGDVVTAAAAFTAATAEGQGLNPWLIFLAATLGTFIGSNISFIIGWRGGRDLIERVGPRFGIKVESIEAGEEYFARRGSETLIIARFVAVMKNLAPALAGASRMNPFWFEVYTMVGSAGYAAILVGIGWFLGANFRQGLAYLGAFSWIVFALIVVGGIFLWVGKRRHDRRMVAERAADFEAEHGGRHGATAADRATLTAADHGAGPPDRESAADDDA